MTAGVAESFAIAKHADGATVRLVLAGDLDVCTAETLVVFVGHATAVPEVHAVLIDLRAVSFLDAAGIRALLPAARRNPARYPWAAGPPGARARRRQRNWRPG